MLNLGSSLRPAPLSGIPYGLSAMQMHDGIILTNLRLRTLDDLESAMLQLMTAAAIPLPYVMLQSPFFQFNGLAYLLYFTAISRLKPLESALMSYIDPISVVF